MDRVVWITGASSGIGEALSHEFSRQGALIVLTGRRVDRLEEVRAACMSPDRHLVFPLDLTQSDLFQEAHEQIVERFGHIDILINNGGVGQRASALETLPAIERRIMEVNYFSAVGLTKTCLPAMIERGEGQIVVVSSLQGKISIPERSSYAASKHALVGYYESLQAELHGTGVSVTIAYPGYVRTEASARALHGDGHEHGTMDETHARAMSAAQCARRLVKAIRKRRSAVQVSGKESLAVLLYRISPPLFRWLVKTLYARRS